MTNIIGYGIIAIPIRLGEKTRWANRKELALSHLYDTQQFDTLDDAEEKSRYLNKHLPMHYPYDFRPISIRTLPTNVRFYHKPIVLDNKLKSKSKSIDAFSY